MALLVSSDRERRLHHKKLPSICLNVSPSSLRLWRPWLKLAAILRNDHSICFQLPCFSAQIHYALRARTVITAWVRSTSHAIQNSQFLDHYHKHLIYAKCVFSQLLVDVCANLVVTKQTTENSTNTKVLLSTELERFQALELSWICCSQQAKLAFFGTWIFLWTWTSANWAKRWDEFFEVVLLGEEGHLQFEWDMKDWTSFFTAVC